MNWQKWGEKARGTRGQVRSFPGFRLTRAPPANHDTEAQRGKETCLRSHSQAGETRAKMCGLFSLHSLSPRKRGNVSDQRGGSPSGTWMEPQHGKGPAGKVTCRGCDRSRQVAEGDLWDGELPPALQPLGMPLRVSVSGSHPRQGEPGPTPSRPTVAEVRPQGGPALQTWPPLSASCSTPMRTQFPEPWPHLHPSTGSGAITQHRLLPRPAVRLARPSRGETERMDASPRLSPRTPQAKAQLTGVTGSRWSCIKGR